jgi:hypothetical protein
VRRAEGLALRVQDEDGKVSEEDLVGFCRDLQLGCHDDVSAFFKSLDTEGSGYIEHGAWTRALQDAELQSESVLETRGISSAGLSTAGENVKFPPPQKKAKELDARLVGGENVRIPFQEKAAEECQTRNVRLKEDGQGGIDEPELGDRMDEENYFFVTIDSEASSTVTSSPQLTALDTAPASKKARAAAASASSSSSTPTSRAAQHRAHTQARPERPSLQLKNPTGIIDKEKTLKIESRRDMALRALAAGKGPLLRAVHVQQQSAHPTPPAWLDSRDALSQRTWTGSESMYRMMRTSLASADRQRGKNQCGWGKSGGSGQEMYEADVGFEKLSMFLGGRRDMDTETDALWGGGFGCVDADAKTCNRDSLMSVFSYVHRDVALEQNQPMSPLFPVDLSELHLVHMRKGAKFSVDPPLPLGLELDADSGTIWGKFLVLFAQQAPQGPQFGSLYPALHK